MQSKDWQVKKDRCKASVHAGAGSTEPGRSQGNEDMEPISKVAIGYCH